ncbi:unnamed protein product, partial [Closterium sp. Yama58-4]
LRPTRRNGKVVGDRGNASGKLWIKGIKTPKKEFYFVTKICLDNIRMARFFLASDPAIEQYFAMLDSAASSAYHKDEEDAWEYACREGIRSSHGHFFRDFEPRAFESTRKLHREGIRSSHGGSYFRDIEWKPAPIADRTSESAHGGMRPHRESARKRWAGESFALAGSGTTSRGGTRRRPLQAYGAAIFRVSEASEVSSDSRSGSAEPSYLANQSSTAGFTGTAEPSSARRSITCTAPPAAGISQATGSHQDSPKSPLLFVAGRSPSESSTASSSESTPSELSSVGRMATAGTEFKGRIKAGDCAVKVLGGANPAAVELYFKRKAHERARAVGQPASVLTAVSGS